MNQQKIASLWSRIGGALIDLIVVIIASFVISFAWSFFVGLSGTERYLSKDETDALWKVRGMLVGLLFDGIYTVVMMAGSKQSTFGQRAVGIKIVKENGAKIDFGTAIVRWITSLFSSILLKIGFLIAVFTKNKRTLHDLVSGTIVVVSETETPIVNEEITYSEIHTPKIKKDEVEIDFSLSTSSFKNSYDVNDYDIAHAKNELLGKIPNVSMNTQLMDYCKSTSNSDKEAEKKYILTRAYQISKSISRNEPHKVQSDASESLKILKKHGYDFSTRNESRVNYYSEPKNNGIFSWRSFLTAVAIILAVVVGYNAIGTENKANEIKLSVKEKINESKSAENFYNSDMSYELKNCFDIDGSGQVFSYKKLKTSIVEKYAILISESGKLYFDECFLNGRYYQCKNKKDEEVIQITFDVIDMHFWQELSDEVDATNFNMKFECDVR